MPQHFTTATLSATLSAVTLAGADGAQMELLDLAQKQVGWIPNMYANMVNVLGVLSTYRHGYAAFRKDSGFTPRSRKSCSSPSARSTAAPTARRRTA